MKAGVIEEGEFTDCAEVLEDWWNSCNVQGKAEMETIECTELAECMRGIGDRQAPQIESLQARISYLELEVSWRVQDAAQIANAFRDVFNSVGHITEVSDGFNGVEQVIQAYEGREDESPQ